jgi:hypothetical protein
MHDSIGRVVRCLRAAISVFIFAVLSINASFRCEAQSAKRSVRVWLIPAENAGPNDIAQGERIPEQMAALRKSLEGTGVRLLNVEDPLALKAIFWNPQFNVPNFQVVATQSKTLDALKEFARDNGVEVVVRLVTWDEAFGLLNAGQTEGPDALPDVAQVGSSWAGYLAGRKAITAKPDSAHNRGNWRDVLNVPASALPYTNDVRLLFYWKRLPAAEPDSKPVLELNNSSWSALMDSLRDGTSQGDTLVFPTGVTLNLLHDYLPLVRAGTKNQLLSVGALGVSIDLSSEDALRCPAYLASQTRIPQANGQTRRLISFPEGSHQEASRTFVNGGYRGTIEPANFIGQWFQDFEERQDIAEKQGHPRKHFWDYAAAVVPPSNFKGGSELVILSNAKDPALAAELADYLATNSDYTKVLAHAGLLPAGRPGYGINELVESFGSERESAEAHAFSQAVQKAIDQGVPYPDFEQWPVVLENRAVLESLQQVWRRMSEGDVKGMTLAARRVQGQINSQTYLPTRTWEAFSRAWPLLLFVSASLAAVAAWVRARSLRRLITILHLYRASRHESGKILGENVRDLHEQARTGALTHDALMGWLLTLANLYTDPNNGLVAYMVSLGDDLVRQIQGVKASGNLNDVVRRGFDGAQLFYKASRLMRSPTVTLVPKGLAEWRVARYPALAAVVLQEWFFNCIREIDFGSGSVISVEVQDGAVLIESSGDLTEKQIATLKAPPSSGLLEANASGLILIRDICRYGFGSRVKVNQAEHKISLSIPLRIRKSQTKR